MKKKYLILLLFLLIGSLCFAQKENSNWFFGLGAGLTWTTTTSYNATGVFGTPDATLTGMPSSITGSPLSTYEWCFSISDVDGNLLFFSDGSTIWDKNMSVMINGTGLTGHASSAQSGVIFPYPYSSTKYIALTLGIQGTNNLSYSIVDMSQNLGLGAVDATQKNVLLTGQFGSLGESVAAVRHSNRNDFWIVAPGRSTTTPSYLNVWKVASAGVTESLHSYVPVNIATTPTSAGGYIRFTSDGLHFVWIDFNNKLFTYGDFDPSTGIISNVRVRTNNKLTSTAGYGADFSPSGKYLYLTYVPPGRSSTSTFQSSIYVYDFDALLSNITPNAEVPDPIKKVSTPLSAPTGDGDHFGAIQTGPDGRMYTTRFASKGMFVIDNPEDPINMKIYKLTNILSKDAFWGLPNFSAPWFRMIIDPPTNTERCAGITANYSFEILNGMGFTNVTKIVLDFGEGGTGSTITYTNPTLGTYTESYTYKRGGTHTITATAYNKNGGVELISTSQIIIHTCALSVNPHIRGINE